MALGLMYYSLVIPIGNIPNFDAYLSEMNYRIGPDIRYGEYLYAESEMSYDEIESRLEYWKERAGLFGIVEHQGPNHWMDLCCVGQSMGLYPDAVCEWIHYDPFENCVSHVNDKQREIVSPIYVRKHDSNGYVIEGKYLSPTRINRGVSGLGNGLWANFDTSELFRLVLPISWKRERCITQRVCILDFASDKEFVHEFDLLADRRTILEIDGANGTAEINHVPFEPIDPERVARLPALSGKAPLVQGEIDELLAAIADGILVEGKGPPSTGMQGREVSIQTRRLYDGFDAFDYEYFAWYANPASNHIGDTSPQTLSFETVLAGTMKKAGSTFTEVGDPYLVDWNRTLFLRAVETMSADGAEVTLEIKILKITLTTYRESGQPCLAEEPVWEGNFALVASFYYGHQEDVAKKISRQICGKDENQVAEW